MKSFLNQSSSFAPFRAGDPLLESQRRTQSGLSVLKKSGGSKPAGEKKPPFQPDEGDFELLSVGLELFKMSPENTKELFNAIGSTINLATGIVSVVGAVSSILDLAKKAGILSDDSFDSEKALQQIGLTVTQIYGYLALTDSSTLHAKAVDWRGRATSVRTEMENLSVSRSPLNLQTMIDRLAELDGVLLTMLDPGIGKIAFQKTTYNSAPWIDAARYPFVQTAAGQSVDYGAPGRELQSPIWDAGYYLDVLIIALRHRLSVAALLEPAFRSSGYNRAKLATIAGGLHQFCMQWRSSILVFDPIYAMNPGGEMRHPTLSAPQGVPLGAVDPVSGVSSFEQLWDGFDIRCSRTSLPGEAWGGVWDETEAVDPAVATQSALAVHVAAIDRVVKASGLEQLQKLTSALFEMARPPAASDFVFLPNAKFRRPRAIVVAVNGLATSSVVDAGAVNLDLGTLGTFSPHPGRVYNGRRYLQEGEKYFTFKMARRTDVSRIQLGYRLRVGDQNTVLVEFSAAPPVGQTVLEFPQTPLQSDIEFETTLYDCCQEALTSASSEDDFEAKGRIPGVRRLFFNPRQGMAKFRLNVSFTPFAENAANGYMGECHVRMAALDVVANPHAYILDFQVFETRLGIDNIPGEVLADSMSVHMVPSFLVMEQTMFDDIAAAEERLDGIVKSMDDRFTRHEIQIGPPIPDPAWKVTERSGRILRQVKAIDQLRRAGGEELEQELADYLIPTIRRG
jgi:hypothetical protein